MTFRKLVLSEWRQFKQVEIEFHDRLTVLTGANGAGKTTLLNLLGQLFRFGSPSQLVSTPLRSRSMGLLSYFSGLWRDRSESVQNIIGELSYSNGEVATLTVPADVGQTYQVQIHPQAPVIGFSIPAHRPTFSYRPVGNIPTSIPTREMAFTRYHQLVKQLYVNAPTTEAPSQAIKEILISWAAFGYGNSAVVGNPEAVRTFERFQEILRVMLPPKLGFRGLSVRSPEVVLETASGEFSLDAVSGGVASLIDICWQIFMFEPANPEYVITIDEPENHLHPELQRSILPNLLQAFPTAQFIIATHNPLVISSVFESKVYALLYEDGDNRTSVVTTRLDLDRRAGTSDEILRSALGLEASTPIWATAKLKSVMKQFSQRTISESTLAEFKQRLSDFGLNDFIPDTVAEVIQSNTFDKDYSP